MIEKINELENFLIHMSDKKDFNYNDHHHILNRIEELRTMCKEGGEKSNSVLHSIIHSQPQEGFHYWVRLFAAREYEVARPRLKNDGHMWFCFTNGSHKRSDEVDDWKKTPLIFNEGDYG